MMSANTLEKQYIFSIFEIVGHIGGRIRFSRGSSSEGDSEVKIGNFFSIPS